MPEPLPPEVPSATVTPPRGAMDVLHYAPATTRRLWSWIRPGTPLFFLIVLALAAGGMWGGWKWQLRRDRLEFEACSIPVANGRNFAFTHTPPRGALRHLARLPATHEISLDWPAADSADGAAALAVVKLPNVTRVDVQSGIDVDAVLKTLARPDCGLKALTTLDIWGSKVTDAGLKELARPDSGLKALTSLHLEGTNVTDAGLKELARPDCGLKALTALYLHNTQVTDAGLKELARPNCGLRALTHLFLWNTRVTDAGLAEVARPDCGLKALTTLYVGGARVTDAGVAKLKKARPGITINR